MKAATKLSKKKEEEEVRIKDKKKIGIKIADRKWREKKYHYTQNTWRKDEQKPEDWERGEKW